MKRDNRGLSLVELIVVVAILSIFVGGTVLGLGLISNKSVDKCADKLRLTMQNNRVTTMGRLDSRLEIYLDGDTIYIQEFVKKDASGYVAGTPVELGDAGLTMKFTLSDSSGTVLTLGDPGCPARIILQYDRSSGAFKDLSAMGSAYAGKYCTKIEISKGSKLRTISISYLTGKISVE